MRIIHTLPQLTQFLENCKAKNEQLGFVPTMGALHNAHVALAKTSMAQNQATLVSIFVNPTQFNNAVDLEKYPRRVNEDLQKLGEAGVTAAYLPSVQDLYGDEVLAENIDLNGLDVGMEGDHRPGHFAGVATVIKRFFLLLKPTRAYFGEKDYQQLRVIEYLNESLNLGAQVVGCPTERTPEGLAMSSRNYRLNDEGLKEALIIYKNLKWAAENHRAVDPKEIIATIERNFEQSPLELEYVQIADPSTMKPIQHWAEASHARIFLAAFCQGVRLIDNYPLF